MQRQCSHSSSSSKWAHLYAGAGAGDMVPSAPPAPRKGPAREQARSSPHGEVGQRELLWAYKWCSGAYLLPYGASRGRLRKQQPRFTVPRLFT